MVFVIVGLMVIEEICARDRDVRGIMKIVLGMVFVILL